MRPDQNGAMILRKMLFVFVVNMVLFTISTYLYNHTQSKVVNLAETPYQYIEHLDRQRFPGDYDGTGHVHPPHSQTTNGVQGKHGKLHSVEGVSVLYCLESLYRRVTT